MLNPTHINFPVPLTAYDLVQVSTYTPNDTVLPLAFASLVPVSMRGDPTDNFTPHTFRVGDSFRTNFSLFDSYTIETVDALVDRPPGPGDTSEDSWSYVPIQSFAYANNGFNACDVIRVVVSMDAVQTIGSVCYLELNS